MTGLVILAAGASTRLGTPKQQLQYQGASLLQRAVQTAVASPCLPVVVVLGANAERILPEVAQQPVLAVHNPEWPEGMASSIRVGLTALLQAQPDISAVVLMLCDQPFVTVELLQQLIETKEKTKQLMVTCAYAGTIGPPVLFDQALFPELLSLKGQEGAKKLLYTHPHSTATIPFPLGAFDIDTPSDYAALKLR